MSRAILHVDMDAFYASVEVRDHPQLKGKPVIVGGVGGRGVVAAASYEVRKFGVHSAMPVREALRRCPEAICVRPRMGRYRAASREIFAIFHEFTPLVEGLSVDEAFLDVTHSQSALGPAATIARGIKQRIFDKTQLTASIGVAPNKLVAKIASDLRKPDGLVIVTPEQVHEVLDPLPIRKLFGIGAKTAPKLEMLGLRSLGDLRHASDAVLRNAFGRHAAQMRARAAGEDERPVVPDWDEKQISAEETFDKDISDHTQLRRELVQLADRTTTRLRNKQLLASCVTVKIRRKDFTTYTRQQHFNPPSQETRAIANLAQRLLDKWLKEQPRVALRLLGVGVSGLIEAQQLNLFAAPESEKNQALDTLVDSIRERYGDLAVVRAEVLRRR